MRQPKPYLFRDWYVTRMGGKMQKLAHKSEGRQAAMDALAVLVGEQAKRTPSMRQAATMTTSELAAEFLDFCEVNKPASTTTHYHYCLKRLVSTLGDKLVSKVALADGVNYKKTLLEKGFHKTWLKNGVVHQGPQQPYSVIRINHLMRSSKTLFNYAVSQGYIPVNPWKKITLETEEGRERIITPAEFNQLLAGANADFRRVLLMLRLSAMRPGELRILTWTMVHLDRSVIVIPARQHKTGKRTGKDRVIPLLPVVVKMLAWIKARSNKVLVFPNPQTGKQWTPDTISQHFSRLRERTGIQIVDEEKLVLYSNRHSRLTELGTQVVPGVVQEVAGHATYKMTQRYLHPGAEDIVKAVMDADRKKKDGA